MASTRLSSALAAAQKRKAMGGVSSEETSGFMADLQAHMDRLRQQELAEGVEEKYSKTLQGQVKAVQARLERLERAVLDAISQIDVNPMVTVQAPDVKIPPAPKPTVNVPPVNLQPILDAIRAMKPVVERIEPPAPQKKKWKLKVNRNRDGLIESIDAE